MATSNEERIKLTKELFGQVLFSKANKFIASQINIIRQDDNPVDFRAIILDENNREFHIIIKEDKIFIFHDCPYFLKKEICFHIVKTFLIMPSSLAIKILKNLDEYQLISEDLGSKLKNESYNIEAEKCFEQKQLVEGLNYIKKAYLNKRDSKEIVINYLEASIKNNLLMEFFEFSKLIISEYGDLLSNYIEKAFKRLIPIIKDYNLFDILRIIESINIILPIIDIGFFTSLFESFTNMMEGFDLNESYFSIFIIQNFKEKLIAVNQKFENCLSAEHLNKFQEKILDYFKEQIDNFCLIDESRLLIKHFDIFKIEKSKYINIFDKYEQEVKEIEKKAYLKKFAFLKILIERFKLSKSSLNLQKKRNLYYVVHDPKNMQNSAYKYVIDHIGFNPINENVISSQEIGINYFIFKDIFEDDFNKTDILYYKNQFWQDTEKTFTPQEGLTLLQDDLEHFDLSEYKSLDPNNTILIEWDLANFPQKGSLVNAFDARQIIPDPNNPLTPELKPFDLCFCKKEALLIEGNVLKTVQLIHKCTPQEAIQAIAKGMQFIEKYFPFQIIKSVIEREISPFDAYEIVNNNQNQIFIGNYDSFKKAFNDFLFNHIEEHKDVIFNTIKENPENSYDRLTVLMKLQPVLSGIKYNFSRILNNILPKYEKLAELKKAFLDEIHNFISQKLEEKRMGSTNLFDVKKLLNTPFLKYIEEILSIRKNEFEKNILKKSGEKYDFTPFIKTYFGSIFSRLLKIQQNKPIMVDESQLVKIKEYCGKLDLKLNIE